MDDDKIWQDPHFLSDLDAMMSRIEKEYAQLQKAKFAKPQPRKRPKQRLVAKKLLEPQKCKVTSKNYRQIAKLLKKKGAPRKDLCNKIEQLLPKGCLEEYRVINYIGGGEFGKILAICANKWDCKVLKIVVSGKEDYLSPDQEIEMQKFAAKRGLAPRIYQVCKDKNARFIIMDKVDNILENYLVNKKQKHELDALIVQIFEMINKLCKHRMTHGDLHWGNIGYTLELSPESGRDEEYVPDLHPEKYEPYEFSENGLLGGGRLYAKITLIDFGQSYIGKCHPRVDLLQLIRTADKELIPEMNSFNRNYLHKKLFKIYKSRFNNKLKDNSFAIEKEWDTIRQDYEQLFDFE